MSLLFIVGLTGVGKSTTLAAINNTKKPFTVLPNRRDLTNDIIVPTIQQEEGRELEHITDRVERFRMTRAYRDLHSGGIAHALTTWLEQHPPESDKLVFDSIRGDHEAKYAAIFFPNSRFIVLNASNVVRLQRLCKREDKFDTVKIPNLSRGFRQAMQNIDGMERLFDTENLVQLAQDWQVPEDEFLKALRIVCTEAEHYDQETTSRYLTYNLPPARRLIIDSSEQSVDEISEQIKKWL